MYTLWFLVSSLTLASSSQDRVGSLFLRLARLIVVLLIWFKVLLARGLSIGSGWPVGSNLVFLDLTALLSFLLDSCLVLVFITMCCGFAS